MSEIIKTKAVVLSKINFGNTSKIVSCYTEKFGKLSGIIKGARSQKSKIGALADTMNYVELVFYNKPNRDLQLITQIDLIEHYSIIRDNLERLKYASSVIELIQHLNLENEANQKLFKGLVKILSLINSKEKDPQLLFSKFFLFFLEQMGYGLNFKKCNVCGKTLSDEKTVSFDYVRGFLCQSCSNSSISPYKFQKELFKILMCISSKLQICSYTNSGLNSIIHFLENYLKYHISEFKGLKSIYLY